ncbi:MAG: nucleotide exchange factor GrpE [Vicinamibacterales bacterium]
MKVVDRRWWVREPGEQAGEEQPEGALKPTYVVEIERQLAEKDRQLQETIAAYRAAAKEFDDVRARLRRDVTKEVERGRRIMLAELLDVVDNLDRAVETGHQVASTQGGEVVGPLLEGIEMVRRQFLAKLEGFGVTRMAPLGQPFDPSLHEAVTALPTDDPEADGCVAGVIREGYKVGEEVLRPAWVAVRRLGG